MGLSYFFFSVPLGPQVQLIYSNLILFNTSISVSVSISISSILVIIISRSSSSTIWFLCGAHASPLLIDWHRCDSLHRLSWPLHDIAIANIVCCMAYKSGVGGGVVCCAMDVQRYCNSAGNAGGRGQWTDDRIVHKSIEVKQYLVKAKGYRRWLAG